MFDGFDIDRLVDCAIRYGYELGGSARASLVSYLPVRYAPKFTYGPSETVRAIINAVLSWQDEENPAPTGGEWVFGVSLYSSVDGQLERPLLELRRLISRIEPG